MDELTRGIYFVLADAGSADEAEYPCHMDHLSWEEYPETMATGQADQREIFCACGCWISRPRQNILKPCHMDQPSWGNILTPSSMDQLTREKYSAPRPVVDQRQNILKPCPTDQL